ncbi:MAG: SO2930 family diheme c-type cytochrome [Actinomycetota bacterium]
MTRTDAAVGGLVLALALLIGCSTSQDDATVDTSAVTAEPTIAAAESTPPPTVQPDPHVDAVSGAGPTWHPENNPESLDAWGQLAVVQGVLAPVDDVLAYELNSALFSDHAHKLRTVWLPEGAGPADYDGTDTFAFPVGTVITKTFWYPLPDGAAAHDGRVLQTATPADLVPTIDLATSRVVETRILVHRADGWEALPYVWNAEQTEATLQRTGDLQILTLVAADTGSDEPEAEFPYVVPNVNQCAGCHATNHTSGEIVPIGPKARHLNRTIDAGFGAINQLDHWRTTGLLAGGPSAEEAPRSAIWTDPTAPLDARARAYLDINCAHCHNEVGPADTSGLFLEPTTPVDRALGLCKPPVAAGSGTGGRQFGIAPGEPADSIFVYRMQTTDPGEMMPELGRARPHEEGIELISAWIATLPGSC